MTRNDVLQALENFVKRTCIEFILKKACGIAESKKLTKQVFWDDRTFNSDYLNSSQAKEWNVPCGRCDFYDGEELVGSMPFKYSEITDKPNLAFKTMNGKDYQ